MQVRAAGVNPLDRKSAKGNCFFLRFPYVLGSDFAGEVVSVGVRANKFKAGDPIFAFSDPRRGAG